MDPQPSTHASEPARETKFLLDEGAFFDWGRDDQTLSECSTEREMQMGLVFFVIMHKLHIRENCLIPRRSEEPVLFTGRSAEAGLDLTLSVSD